MTGNLAAARLPWLGQGAAARYGPLLEEQFGAGQPLYGLRQVVRAHAAAAGLSGPRVRDLVIAAHELAANAIRHGAGQGLLRMWSQGGALHCQVDDSGPPGRGVPAAGDGVNAAAGWPVMQPHGLWLVRLLADQVSVVSGRGGTSATVAFTLPG